MSGSEVLSDFELNSPHLIIDLDILDKNLESMVNGSNGKNLCIVFKSPSVRTYSGWMCWVPLPEIGDKRKVVIKRLICNPQVFKC